MQLDASETELAFTFFNRNGVLIDSITIDSPAPPPPPAPPIAPTGLLAAATSNTAINLTWSDNSNNETGFRIERSIAGQGFVEIATVAAGITSFSNTNLTGGTAYAYRVRAYNTSFTSSYTNGAAATTPAAALPSPWLNSDIGAVGATGSASAINGVFTINGSGDNVWGTADSFNYAYRSWTGDGQIVARATLPNDGFEGIMFRESLAANSKQTSVLIDDSRTGFVRRTTTGGTSTSNDVNVAAPQYLKLIRTGDSFTAYRSATGSGWTQIGGAINIPMAPTIFVGLLGCSTDAGIIQTFTMDNVQTSVSTAVTPTLPTAPSGLAASAAGACQIDLTWTDASTNEDGFKIERRVGFGAWLEIATVAAGVTSYSSTVLASSTGYSYRVRAFNNLAGNSTYSSIATATTAAGATSPLIPPGASWKYLDNGVDQGTAWRGVSFDDSIWASGGAQLGYGDGDENTSVSFGGNPANRYITTYFRKSFTVADPSLIGALSLGLLRDDGAVVYLNGQEVFRSNMPTGTIGYATAASSVVSGAAETTYFTAAINRALVVGGTNVIAVELHQRSASDSDLSFDLQLNATASNPALPPSAPSGLAASAISATQVNLNWIDSATTEAGFRIERSADGINFAEIATVAAGATSYSDSTVTGGVQYWYRVRAYNIAGSSSHTTATVTTPMLETLDKPMQKWRRLLRL
jgi:hypothetical protein